LFDIGNSLEQGFNVFFAFLPKLIAFLVILLIGYIVARVIRGILTTVLQRVGLDRALHKGQAGQYVEKVVSSPSALIGRVAFWLVFLGVLSIAVSALGIPALTAFLAAIYAYVPNVIAALLIFLVAGAIAAAIGGLVAKTMGDTPTGKIVGTVVPVLVMGVAVFMILTQLKIAPEIVQILFTALVGAVALGMALAFGLGGRNVAERLLEDAYSKGQEQTDQVKQDMQTGKERGQRQAQDAKQQAQERADSQGSRAGAQPGAERI